MSVNLQKGQKVDLSKDGGGTLSKVIVGLGWDVAETPRIGARKEDSNVDCDAIAILCESNGKTNGIEDTVYFGNLEHSSKAVHHTGDNITGEGEGDDEQIIVELNRIPDKFKKIVFAVSIYKGKEKKQHFGLINNAFIRAVDASTDKELFKYDLSENYSGKTGMIFGEFYRDGGKWKFAAIGEPVDNGSYVKDLVNLYL
ncbi:MAG: TerD family protein [Treponema sp.]|jgi:stress response protein SCP2|nr:TerD family protein [Treponema sp.]